MGRSVPGTRLLLLGPSVGTCLESGPTPISPLFRLYVYNCTHCLGPLIINTYSMHKFSLILCIITHLKHFSDDGMYDNRPQTVVTCHGICAEALSFALLIVHSVVRKCFIIHNYISENVCILYPRRSSKNCDLQFANFDRLKEKYSIDTS